MAKKQQKKNQNSHPLAHQMANLLNNAGAVNPDVLDQGGTASANPILNKILGFGYKRGSSGPLGSWQATMSDRDALGAAISAGRGGASLIPTDSQNPMEQLHGLGNNTASRNFVKSLMQARIAQGMSPEEARQSLSAELTRENRTLRLGDKAVGLKDAGLTPDEQAVLQNRDMKAAGIPSSQPSPGDGSANDAFAGSRTGYGAYDPVGMSQSMGQQNYYDQGLNDIATYNQNAQLLGGIVPEQLKPLYDIMVQQRVGQMQNNLDLMNAQMQGYPMIQQLTNAAQDFRTAQKAGSQPSALDQALGAAGGSSGTGGGGQSGIGSNGASDGLDLSRQIMNGIQYGNYMGSQFKKFETPVISNNQLTFLRDFLPRSNKGAAMVPAIANYLGAQTYPQMGFSQSGY